MALVWSWGWEINAPREKYNEAGWLQVGSDEITTNYSDSAQPLAGSGGGSICLRLEDDDSSLTIPTNYFSITEGWITCYIKFVVPPTGYGLGNNKDIISIGDLGGEHISLRTFLPAGGTYNEGSAQIKLIGTDGTESETLLGDHQKNVWHRIAIQISSASGTSKIEKVYINGIQATSASIPGSVSYTNPINTITFHGCMYHRDEGIHIDHIFIYDDETDDGDKELYIHGLNANAVITNTGWTNETGADVSSNLSELQTTGDNSFLLCSDEINELSLQVPSPGSINLDPFQSIQAINQITFNHGTGDLNRLETSILLDLGNPSPDKIITEVDNLSTNGIFTNTLITNDQIIDNSYTTLHQLINNGSIQNKFVLREQPAPTINDMYLSWGTLANQDPSNLVLAALSPPQDAHMLGTWSWIGGPMNAPTPINDMEPETWAQMITGQNGSFQYNLLSLGLNINVYADATEETYGTVPPSYSQPNTETCLWKAQGVQFPDGSGEFTDQFEIFSTNAIMPAVQLYITPLQMYLSMNYIEVLRNLNGIPSGDINFCFLTCEYTATNLEGTSSTATYTTKFQMTNGPWL